MTSDYVGALEAVAWLEMQIKARREQGLDVTALLVDMQHAVDELADCIKAELRGRL